MSRIQSIAHTPPTTVSLEDTVTEAVKAMVRDKVGAAGVVTDGRLKGIFTERDLMTKVVSLGRDPEATKVAEVMTADVEPLSPTATVGHAFRVMNRRHFRHMPVCDDDGTVLGMLSMRDLLYHHVDKLSDELDSLEAFLLADGPGG